MNKKMWYFYKGEASEYGADPFWDFPVDTYFYNPTGPTKWRKTITVRGDTVWTKVALRNVPKKYRALLLILE